MCQGFSHFSGFFLHHFVLAKLATSSIRVNITYNNKGQQYPAALAQCGRKGSSVHRAGLYMCKNTPEQPLSSIPQLLVVASYKNTTHGNSKEPTANMATFLEL